MLPVVALVGRPNVGKSTLYNALTRTRDAIVSDLPGVTRDRHYGLWEGEGGRFMLVDTAGLSGDTDALAQHMSTQARLAIAEADLVLMLVDGRDGLLPDDIERFLGGEALDARRDSALYVLRKSVARHRGKVLAVGAVFGVGFFREWDTERRLKKNRVAVPDQPVLAPEERGRRKLVRRAHFMTIIAAWVITVPAAALMSAAIFYGIRAFAG